MVKILRYVFITTSTMVILFSGVYVGAGMYLYDSITTIPFDCDYLGVGENTPDNFLLRYDVRGTLDPNQYRITSGYEDVTFSPRGMDDVTLRGWFIPAEVEDAPVIVFVHGMGTCKQEGTILVAAAVMHREGFHVLTFDLSDHETSDRVDGRFNGGATEYLDVLGAVDWLQREKGIPPERTLLAGASLGAASASIAFAQEPEIAALWVDSAYTTLPELIHYTVNQQYHLPHFLTENVILVAEVLNGVDLNALDPTEAFTVARYGRPVFVVHSTYDSRVSVEFAYELERLTQQTDPTFRAWILPDGDHAQAFYLHHEQYIKKLVHFANSALR